MATIYLVNIDTAMEGSIACESLKEARRVRRDCGTPGLDGEIHRCTVGKQRLRALLCALYNRQGWATARIKVAPCLPRRKEDTP